jgi:hypothetical protein
MIAGPNLLHHSPPYYQNENMSLGGDGGRVRLFKPTF